jgi:hypothetical protein
MTKIFNILTAAAGLILAVFLIGLLISYPFMMLWNYCLVPAVTVLTEVTWLQAFGILVACGFMFKENAAGTKK